MTTELVDESAIQAVLARYCHHCDDGDFAALAKLFATDGTFAYQERSVTGRETVRAYFEEVQTPERRGKHLTANAVVTLDGDDARVTSDWTFLAFVDGVLTPKLTGRYDDHLVRVDGQWLIAQRRVTPLTAS